MGNYEDWALDAVGNWHGFKQDNTGGGYTLDQTRTSNTDNEITAISGTGGADWVDPVYSAAGNMTTIPKPAAPTTSFDAKYDAWNRLVQLKDTASGQTVAEYAYDGLFRRVVKKTYTSGSLSETRHFYYSDAWQVLEERVEASGSQRLDRQFLWGIQYIDDLLLRDRDTNADGTLDERMYAMQDANWNVTSLWGLNSGATAWEVKERFEYDPYGVASVLTASFGSSSDGYQWETRYAGYRWDSESSHYHVRFRYLNPALGVWVTRDPLGHNVSVDHSEYCHSLPTTSIDPMGLDGWFRVDMVAKSFINGIPVVGTLPWPGGPILATVIPVGPEKQTIIDQFNPANERLRLFALAVSILGAFNQNPLTPNKDQSYRLYTRIDIRFCCRGNQITDMKYDTDRDGGKELPGIYGTINLDGGFGTNAPIVRLVGKVLINAMWRGWGRPNLLVEPGMQAVYPRLSVNIWHEAHVWIECKNGKGEYTIKSFEGSRFPSHRLWINDVEERNLRQGAFSDLWRPMPGHPTFVR